MLLLSSGDRDLNFKIALGGLGSAFMLGTIFWAGAAYNRLSSMELHMASIDSKLSDISALNERVANQREELDRLRQELHELERK